MSTLKHFKYKDNQAVNSIFLTLFCKYNVLVVICIFINYLFIFSRLNIFFIKTFEVLEFIIIPNFFTISN